TRAVLKATGDLARARGAAPLLVVPQIGAEDPTESALRHRVLDEGGIPYVPVPVDGRWTVEPSDRHPDARGAHAIALAIAAVYDGTMSFAPPRRAHGQHPLGIPLRLNAGRDRGPRLRALDVVASRRASADRRPH